MSDVRVNVWTRSIVGWHIAFWLVLGLAVVRVVTAAGEDYPGNHRALALVLLTVLGLAYLPVSLRGRECATWREYLYLTVAVIVTGVSCWLDPTLSLLLFSVFAQAWLFTRSTREGAFVVVLLTVSAGSGFMTGAGWSLEALRAIGPSMAVSMVFSVMLGFWVSSIIEQSRDRAELIDQLEAARSELAEAHHSQGVLAERERMSREIHDTLAQSFTSVITLAQAASAETERGTASPTPRLQAIEDIAREGLAESRALVAAFSPVQLDGATLTGALERLAERFGRETGLAVSVSVGEDLPGLVRDQEVVLLRAAQEALTNVRRHAHAQHVLIELVSRADGAGVVVRDDGIGLAPDQPEGFGLSGMRGRVDAVGGALDVHSEPGIGTKVSVWVPLSAQPA